MTPEELDRILCRKLCGDANECSSLHYAFRENRRAALRERDAEHEIALKKARADALEEAARLAEQFSVKAARELYPGVRWEDMNQGAQTGAHMAAQSIAWDIRALLEEAGSAVPDPWGCGKKHFGCHCVLCRAALAAPK